MSDVEGCKCAQAGASAAADRTCSTLKRRNEVCEDAVDARIELVVAKRSPLLRPQPLAHRSLMRGINEQNRTQHSAALLFTSCSISTVPCVRGIIVSARCCVPGCSLDGQTRSLTVGQQYKSVLIGEKLCSTLRIDIDNLCAPYARFVRPDLRLAWCLKRNFATSRSWSLSAPREYVFRKPCHSGAAR